MTAKGKPTVLLERPLSARSAVLSLLLGMRPPRAPGARLVRWCGVFGIAEGTARVALSRMTERGELRTSDGVYELAGRVRARQDPQDWSVAPALEDWDGGWSMAAVIGGGRPAAERTALRDAMRALRHVELREGVWVRPDNLPRRAGAPDAWSVADAQCEWWRGTPAEDARALAARLFDPDAWAARAELLDRALVAATDQLGTGDDAVLARAFEAGAASLAHIRRDPLLPAAVCPEPWPGDHLRTTYVTYQRTFARAVAQWFRTPSHRPV